MLRSFLLQMANVEGNCSAILDEVKGLLYHDLYSSAHRAASGALVYLPAAADSALDHDAHIPVTNPVWC